MEAIETNPAETAETGEKSFDWNLKGKSIRELETIFKELGEPVYRAKQAFRRINKHQASSLDDFSEFPKTLREKLKEMRCFPDVPMIHTALDEGGTEKVIFSLGKDRRGGEKKIEAVWIVSERRRTICISSQAGCSLNCTFCATGTLDFTGNLSPWHIVEQVYALMRHRKEKPTNIVFMGMGEPFYNYDNVLKAAHLLNHPDGLHLGAHHITISTAGVIPGIERFTKDREPFNLAVSLNHPDPEGRSEIMDVNKRFPLNKLLEAVRKYTNEMDRRVTFEYVMISGVNIGPDNARKLIKIARSVRCKINLIPLNTALQNYKRPAPEEIAQFQNMLLDADLTVFNRGSPGRAIAGACGMLALKT